MRRNVIILIAALLAAPGVRAENLTTLSGSIFTNAAVMKADSESLVIRHDGGIAVVLASDLTAEDRERFLQVEPLLITPEPTAEESQEESPAPAESAADFSVSHIITGRAGMRTHRVLFTIENHTEHMQSLTAVLIPGYTEKKLTLPPNGRESGITLHGRYSRPRTLSVTDGQTTTNIPLHW